MTITNFSKNFTLGITAFATFAVLQDVRGS
jgi:hypothetical protein